MPFFNVQTNVAVEVALFVSVTVDFPGVTVSFVGARPLMTEPTSWPAEAGSEVSEAIGSAFRLCQAAANAAMLASGGGPASTAVEVAVQALAAAAKHKTPTAIAVRPRLNIMCRSIPWGRSNPGCPTPLAQRVRGLRRVTERQM